MPRAAPVQKREAARKAEAVQTAAPAQDAAACACASPQGGALPWRPDLHAGAQGGHEPSAAGRLGRFRRTLAGFRRRGQGGFAPLSKLGHPRRERHLHDGGIDIPQGVLGSERTLRPRGGFVRRGEARELADEPIAQGGRCLRSKGLFGRRPRLAVPGEGARVRPPRVRPHRFR